jgi:hypothetical protein
MTDQVTNEPGELKNTEPERAATPSPEHARRPMKERGRTLLADAKVALRKPSVGATVAGVTVLAAGALWGVTEAVVASIAAYAVFRTLKKGARRSAPAPVGEPTASTA